MRGVEAATLSGLQGVEEDVRQPVHLEAVGVDARDVAGEGEDPHPVRFHKVQQVADRRLAEPPAFTDDGGGALRVVALEGGDVGRGQVEAAVDPARETDGDRAGRGRAVALPRGHLAERSEADGLDRDEVEVGRGEERRRDLQGSGEGLNVGGQRLDGAVLPPADGPGRDLGLAAEGCGGQASAEARELEPRGVQGHGLQCANRLCSTHLGSTLMSIPSSSSPSSKGTSATPRSLLIDPSR